MNKLITLLRSFSPAIKSLLLAQAVYGIGYGVFTVLLNLYLRGIGYSESEIGRILALQTMCSALMSMPLGWLADKTSRKCTYITGIICITAGYSMICLSHTMSSILAAVCVSGTGLGAILVSVLPYLQENSNEQQRAYIFSLNSSLTWTTSIVSGFFAGWLPKLLVNSFPNAISEITGIQYSLWVGVLFILLTLIPAYKMKIASPEEKKTNTDSKYDKYLDNDQEENPIKLIVKFGSVNLLIGFGAGMIVPYFNLYFKDWCSASIPEIGTIFAIGQFGTALGTMLSPFLSKRAGLVKGVVLSQMLSLPFMLWMAFTHNFVICSICFVFRNAFMNLCTPIQQEILMKMIPRYLRARASAVNSMSWNFAWAIAMFFSGGIIKNYGYASSLLIAATAYFSASCLYHYFFGKVKILQK